MTISPTAMLVIAALAIAAVAVIAIRLLIHSIDRELELMAELSKARDQLAERDATITGLRHQVRVHQDRAAAGARAREANRSAHRISHTADMKAAIAKGK